MRLVYPHRPFGSQDGDDCLAGLLGPWPANYPEGEISSTLAPAKDEPSTELVHNYHGVDCGAARPLGVSRGIGASGRGLASNARA